MDEPTAPGLHPQSTRTTTDRLGIGPSLLLRPQQAERKLLILLLPMFAVTCIAAWVTAEIDNLTQWYEYYVLLPSSVIFTGFLIWAVKSKPWDVWRVRTATLILGPGIVLVRHVEVLYDLVQDGFDATHYFGMSSWLILCCGLFMFLLPSRMSWRFAVGYYLISLLAVIYFVAFNRHPMPFFVTSEVLLNSVIAPPVFIVLMSAFTRLRSDYVKARTQADDLRELALLDGLTGLQNRRAFIQSFKRAQSRLKRNKSPLCLLLLDIDHFKHVNDTYGHQVGDEVLVKLGATLTKELRGTDEVFRWGGEEFVALLEETPSSRLMEVAERVRLAVQNARLYEHGPITISIGATHVTPQDDEDSVYQRADEALYASKAAGRNCVTINDKTSKTDFKP